MNLQGTKGRTLIVPVDPNNQRVDLDQGLVDQINAGGGSGGSTTIINNYITNDISGIQAKSADYSGLQPNWIPEPGRIGLSIDLITGQVWWYFNGQWQ